MDRRRPYKNKSDAWIRKYYTQQAQETDKYRIDAANPVDDAVRVAFWEELGYLYREYFLRGLNP